REAFVDLNGLPGRFKGTWIAICACRASIRPSDIVEFRRGGGARLFVRGSRGGEAEPASATDVEPPSLVSVKGAVEPIGIACGGHIRLNASFGDRPHAFLKVILRKSACRGRVDLRGRLVDEANLRRQRSSSNLLQQRRGGTASLKDMRGTAANLQKIDQTVAIEIEDLIRPPSGEGRTRRSLASVIPQGYFETLFDEPAPAIGLEQNA